VDGCFLIRTSSQVHIPYTLSVLHLGKTYNIPIRKRDDDRYALGKPKENEQVQIDFLLVISFYQNNNLIFFQAFSSIDAMVSFYSQEPLMLYSGGEPSGSTTLKISPPPSRY